MSIRTRSGSSTPRSGSSSSSATLVDTNSTASSKAGTKKQKQEKEAEPKDHWVAKEPEGEGIDSSLEHAMAPLHDAHAQQVQNSTRVTHAGGAATAGFAHLHAGPQTNAHLAISALSATVSGTNEAIGPAANLERNALTAGMHATLGQGNAISAVAGVSGGLYTAALTLQTGNDWSIGAFATTTTAGALGAGFSVGKAINEFVGAYGTAFGMADAQLKAAVREVEGEVAKLTLTQDKFAGGQIVGSVGIKMVALAARIWLDKTVKRELQRNATLPQAARALADNGIIRGRLQALGFLQPVFEQIDVTEPRRLQAGEMTSEVRQSSRVLGGAVAVMGVHIGAHKTLLHGSEATVRKDDENSTKVRVKILARQMTSTTASFDIPLLASATASIVQASSTSVSMTVDTSRAKMTDLLAKKRTHLGLSKNFVLPLQIQGEDLSTPQSTFSFWRDKKEIQGVEFSSISHREETRIKNKKVVFFPLVATVMHSPKFGLGYEKETGKKFIDSGANDDGSWVVSGTESTMRRELFGKSGVELKAVYAEVQTLTAPNGPQKNYLLAKKNLITVTRKVGQGNSLALSDQYEFVKKFSTANVPMLAEVASGKLKHAFSLETKVSFVITQADKLKIYKNNLLGKLPFVKKSETSDSTAENKAVSLVVDAALQVAVAKNAPIMQNLARLLGKEDALEVENEIDLLEKVQNRVAKHQVAFPKPPDASTAEGIKELEKKRLPLISKTMDIIDTANTIIDAPLFRVTPKQAQQKKAELESIGKKARRMVTLPGLKLPRLKNNKSFSRLQELQAPLSPPAEERTQPNMSLEEPAEQPLTVELAPAPGGM